MKIDWATITIAICLAAWFISHNVLLPMFNAYLEYKLNCKQMEDIPNEPLPQLYREVENEKGLQGDNVKSDSSKGIEMSDDGIPIHDEELPL